MSKLGLIVIGVVLGMAVTLGGAWWYLEQNYTYQGVLIDPPAPAAEISLTDQNGELFRLSEQRGKVVLIFFGYTYCPDVCPITLSEFKRVKAALGERSQAVRFVYISVDPERDTAERIQAFLANFDPAFTGLTGTRPELESIWQAYGVYQQRQESSSAAGYLVDHSARVYAIDMQGNWRLNYPFGMSAEKIAQDVLHLLKED